MRGFKTPLLPCVLIFALNLLELSAKDLIFPRISVSPSGFTDVALSNTGPEVAQLTLTLFNSNGQPAVASGPNPRVISLPSGGQSAFLITDFFSVSVGDYWLKVQSDKDFVSGFVLFGDNAATVMDGFGAPESSKDQVLPLIQVDPGFQTTAWLLNPSVSTNAVVRIDSVASSGQALTSQNVLLSPGQQSVINAATVQGATATSYWRIVSDTPIFSIETVLNQQDKTLIALPGLSQQNRLATAYVPDFVAADGFTSEINLINQTDQPVVATITAFRPDGALYFVPQVNANPVTRALPPRASMKGSVGSLFGFSATSPQEGWLRIESNTPALSSFVVYGRSLPATRTAVVIQPAPFTSAVFSQQAVNLNPSRLRPKWTVAGADFFHQAITGGFSTRLSVLNQAALTANVTIAWIRRDGSLVQAAQKALTPGQRLSDSAANLLPAAANLNEGLIWIRSDVPIFMSEVFGAAEILANVPAEAAAPTFNPDANQPVVKVSPSLVSLELAASFQFKAQVSNAAGGQVNWTVNGVPGGNAPLGTISAAGLYKAPGQVPIPQVLTVEARSQADPNRTSGVTLEILRRQTLGGNFALPKAVAYVDSLKRLYVAELAAVSGKHPLATVPGAVVSEIASATGDRNAVLTLANELIEKMVPFEDKSGNAYLLMAGHETGQIYRLRLDNRSVVVVASGLNRPSSLALDPITGDMLVTEEGSNGIRIITRSAFDPTASPSKGEPESWRAAVDRSNQLFAVDQPGGIAIDRCTGLVYVTDKKNGCLREYNRATGALRQVLCGLVNPGEILALYRNGLYCNGSFTIFLAEEGDGGKSPARILQIDPTRGSTNSWLVTQGVTDMTWLREGNPYLPPPGKMQEAELDFNNQTGAAPAKNTGLVYGENLNQQAKLVVIPLVEIYKDVKIPETREEAGKRVVASGQVLFRGLFLVGLRDVMLRLSNGNITTTDENGFFEFLNLGPGMYEVVPESKIYDFDPRSRTFTVSPQIAKDEVVTGFNVSGLDFIASAKTFSISGVLTDDNANAMSGVTVTAGTASATTDSKGNYTISGLSPGTYQVQPSKANFVFTPKSQTITIVDQSVTAAPFVGRFVSSPPPPTTFTISGTVTILSSGAPLAGVTINVCPGSGVPCPPGTGTYSAVTDASGNYQVMVPNGTYTIAPSPHPIYSTFIPPTLTVTVSGANVPGQNFTTMF